MVDITPSSAQDLSTGRTSSLSLIDPRIRLLATLAFALVVVSLSSLPALIAALGVALCALGLSGQRWGKTLRQMAGMDGFIIFMLLMLPFTVPGTPLLTVFGHTASHEGLMRAVEIALTANAVILMVLVLIGTMQPVTLGHALGRLKVPAALVHLLLFTVRYIDVLRDEYARARCAMKIRAFHPRTNWHTMRSYGYLVGMMLIRAFERSERILEAMKCRGFHGQIPMVDDLQLRRRDGVFCALTGLVLVSLLMVGA